MSKKPFTENKTVRKIVFSKTSGRCWYCGTDISTKENQFIIDHVVPTFFGGQDAISNLVPCCRACNNSKGRKSLDEFREYFGFKLLNIPIFSMAENEYLKSLGVILPPAPYVCFYGETI